MERMPGKTRRRRYMEPPTRLAWGGGSGISTSQIEEGDRVSKPSVDYHCASNSQSGGSTASLDSGGCGVGAGWSCSFPSSAPMSVLPPSMRGGCIKGKKKSGFNKLGRRRQNEMESTKQSRATGAPSAATSGDVTESAMLWMDKHSPVFSGAVSDLCVSPKKVQDVRSWVESALGGHSAKGLSGPGEAISAGCESKMLILVGSPGIGKSTMIRVLALEMGLQIHQWNDAHHDFAAVGGHGAHNSGILSLPYQSQIASFQEFLHCAGAGFSSLDVGLHVENVFLNGTLGKRKKHGATTQMSPGNDARNSTKGAIILIEELPNLHNSDAEEKFRTALGQHISQSKVPAVLIFSDVCEGKHKPADLERLIDPSLLYSPLVKIMQCHPVTKTKMKKCLEIIAKREHLDPIPKDFHEEIHLTSGGDLRHAIMALQFQLGGNKRRNKRPRLKTEGDVQGKEGRCDRDTRLSTFHALGKLLYAKRQNVDSTKTYPERSDAHDTTSGGVLRTFSKRLASKHEMLLQSIDPRPPLDFSPENVMNESDIGRGGALSFLGYHSPDFFTDIAELSEAFDHFSDASMFLDRQFTMQREYTDSVFPLEYVSSLAGRAVANANKHAAANRFRAFAAPKLFGVMRKRSGNDIKILQLCRRLSLGGQHLPLHANVGSTEALVTDHLPFMRTILPCEINYALDNLYSYAREDGGNSTLTESLSELWRIGKETQLELLKEDDIMDDDSLSASSVQDCVTATSMDMKDEKIQAKDRTAASPTSTVEHLAPSVHPEIIVID